MAIKEDSELQHVLAHLWLALEAVAKGENNAALYELDSIEGLILFDGDDDRLRFLKGIDYGGTRETMPEPEEKSSS